eukprot:6194054-Pleurochrysis_carterae.AAC.1
MHAAQVHEIRQAASHLLRDLRAATAAVVRAITEWKALLRSRYAYFAACPETEMAFFVNGQNYLLRMTSDLHRIPLPASRDPLLLEWFNEQLPWICRQACARAKQTA